VRAASSRALLGGRSLHADALVRAPDPPEPAVVRGHGASGEADSRTQELAASVEHTLLDDLVRLEQQRLRDRQSQCLSCLHVDDEIEFRRALDRKFRRLGALQNLIRDISRTANIARMLAP